MNQIALAFSACARVLRPVVKLALALGLKQAHLQEMLNELLLEEGRASWRARGIEPNLSQLSVTTGMNRKAVTSRVRVPKDALEATETSAAAKVLTLWLQMVTDNPALRTLPITADPKRPSFESTAWLASRGNVHHRAILDELVRMEMVVEQEHDAELRTEGFIPANDLAAMLAFFADNGRDHVNAAVSNILSEQAPFLERSVYASGLSIEACEVIHQEARRRWAGLHHELAHAMRQGVEAQPQGPLGRIRVGIYTYFEEIGAKQSELGNTEPH